MYGVLADVYSDTFYHSCFEVQKGIGVGFDVSKLDDKQVSKLINKPWSVTGENFSTNVWKNKTKLINTLDQELTRMILTGETPQKAIQNIKKAMNTSLNNAKRLVLTEQAYFTSLAQKDAYAELDVEEYEIVSTLDNRTCSDCGEFDGKHFPMNEMSPGVNAPPFHPYCRCTTCPYFDDEFTIGERIAKDEDGNYYEVPEKMTYEEWKEAFVKDVEDLDKGKGASTKTTSKLSKKAIEIISEKDVPKQMKKIDILLDDYTDSPSLWSGTVTVDDTLSAYGKTNRKTKNITIKSSTPIKSKIHELLHCRTNTSNSSKVMDFANASINEGVTELFAELICEDNGITYNPTYKKQVSALRRISAAFQQDEMEFTKELFEIPFTKRYNWLEAQVNGLIDSDTVDMSTQASLLDDLGILYGKIKRGK